MYYPQKISHVIARGDNLYQLARYYQTTVPMILAHNPNIDPYNLQIGASIVIYPGEDYLRQTNNPNPPVCPDDSKKIDLTNSMRLAWSQHVYWTRMFLISTAERLEDQSATTDRLMQNPKDIAGIFANYYSQNIANIVAQLLTEHLQIGGELITALRDGRTAEAEKLTSEWYINADKMANTFNRINPHYDREEMREMLHKHLDLTTQEVAMRLAKRYTEDIEAFNEVEKEAMMMADYFTSGIIKQFPLEFN